MTSLPQKSSELKQQSLQLSSKSNSDTALILNARNSKQLGELDDTEASQLIMRICALIGCQLPSVEAGMLLWEFICRHHWMVTKKAFELAFEMNAAGKLDKRIEHYNSFDGSFVSSVLNAYELKKREAVKESNKTVHQDHAAELLQEPSDDVMQQMLNEHVEQVKKGKTMTANLLGNVMVNWLIKSGRLDESKISDELNRDWENKAKDFVVNHYLHGSYGRWSKLKQQRGNEYQRIREYIISEKKRLCYLWYLTTQVK